MTPLPNHQLIPDGWANHHQPVMNRTLSSVADISSTHEGPPPFPLPDDWTGLEPVQPGMPCRVVELGSASVSVPAEQPTTTRHYQVAFPLDTITDLRPGEGGHIIYVTAAKDQDLVGRKLHVSDVQYGSQQFQRVIQVEDNLTQFEPVPVVAITAANLANHYGASPLHPGWSGYGLASLFGGA